MTNDYDPWRPPGYRLLVQLVDARTVPDAMATVERMFGTQTANAAVVRFGTRKWSGHPLRWIRVERGHRVYVPEGFRRNGQCRT